MLKCEERYVKEVAPEVAVLVIGSRGVCVSYLKKDGSGVGLGGGLGRTLKTLLPDVPRIALKDLDNFRKASQTK